MLKDIIYKRNFFSYFFSNNIKDTHSIVNTYEIRMKWVFYIINDNANSNRVRNRSVNLMNNVIISKYTGESSAYTHYTAYHIPSTHYELYELEFRFRSTWFNDFVFLLLLLASRLGEYKHDASIPAIFGKE